VPLASKKWVGEIQSAEYFLSFSYGCLASFFCFGKHCTKGKTHGRVNCKSSVGGVSVVGSYESVVPRRWNIYQRSRVTTPPWGVENAREVGKPWAQRRHCSVDLALVQYLISIGIRLCQKTDQRKKKIEEEINFISCVKVKNDFVLRVVS